MSLEQINSMLTTVVLPLGLMVAFFYFFLLKPQKKKEKEVADMRNSLDTGDEIVTIGGIVGKIINVKDEEIVIEVGADKTKLRLMKWAISSVEKKTEEE